MKIRRITCLCGAALTRDERDHYAYQCAVCVLREHELIVAHGRDKGHEVAVALSAGQVDLGLRSLRAPRRAKAWSQG